MLQCIVVILYSIVEKLPVQLNKQSIKGIIYRCVIVYSVHCTVQSVQCRVYWNILYTVYVSSTVYSVLYVSIQRVFDSDQYMRYTIILESIKSLYILAYNTEYTVLLHCMKEVQSAMESKYIVSVLTIIQSFLYT